jgi:hypothetical protein
MLDNPDNGRVTLALLGQKLDSLALMEKDHYKDLKESIEKQGACINSLQTDRAAADVRITELQDDVEKLERKSDTWSLLNSLAIGLATMFSAFMIKK